MQPQGKEATNSEGGEMVENRSRTENYHQQSDMFWRLGVMVEGRGACILGRGIQIPTHFGSI